MERYEKGTVLGRGTFGSVYKAVDKETGKVVAIKKIDVGASKEGMHMTALREIKLLKELKGPHIVQLLDVFPHKRKLTLVFEFMESDLEAVIRSRAIVLSPAHVKAYMQIILESLDFCHKRWVLHRDIKPNNMLVSGGGGFKLADFGLARIFGSPSGKLTNQVFARWYRPPELLFGSNCYGACIDIWAVGCVFAELMLRKPWLPGNSDIDQLGKIFQALGTPSKDNWPGLTALPNYVEFKPQVAPPLRQQFPQASQDALDLLSKLVSLDPSRRPTAEEALRHPYFTNDPPPTPREQLPKPPAREDNPLQAPAAAKPAVKLTRPAPAADSGQQRPAKQARMAVSPAGAGAVTAAAPVGGSDILGLGGASPLVPVKS